MSPSLILIYIHISNANNYYKHLYSIPKLTPYPQVPRVDIPYMGYSVRVTDWRYTVWVAFNGTANRGVWGEGDARPDVFYEELYSHKGDDGTGASSVQGICI